MSISSSLSYLIKISITLMTLALGSMAVSTAALAQEEVITDPKPLEIHRGTVQDLGGTEAKTREEWLGGVGGEYTSTDENPDKRSQYMVEKTPYEAKRDGLNVTLPEHDASLGEVQRPSMRLPLINF
ncbi:hypothetical protein PCC8801_0653 [Rippkaea orientalis PCC 8801]|uniref:Uncharacterized protein n=1 Tax=Rippkaea orientalis (strain PCC 8801 / RF-1) TaxID=41431 RepID=B7JXI3_RIPO1|nr:hypothetical protein [Rippkaea orientalis]ACK64740.1 hypothetical protein PCC8801_0653 [Rippkaea orientalis PCC 8801]